jgi:hypothetical protein
MCEAEVKVRWREVMMVVMRLRVERISLVWKAKDIVVFGEGREEIGGGGRRRRVGMEDEVRCGEAGCKADQTQPCCGVWLVCGAQLKPIQ